MSPTPDELPHQQSNFDDVGDFSEMIGLDNVTWHGAGPREVPEELAKLRRTLIEEELKEWLDAIEAGDIDEQADALVDLVYVVMGTAQVYGFPWHELWNDVQRANMTKKRAEADGSNSKRGNGFDAYKPEGWIGPRTHDIMLKNGFHK